MKGDAKSEYTWKLVSENIYVKLQKPVTIINDGNTLTYTFDFITKSEGSQKLIIVYRNEIEVKKIFELDVIVGTIGIITSE